MENPLKRIDYLKLRKVILGTTVAGALAASTFAGQSSLRRYLRDKSFNDEVGKEVGTMISCKVPNEETNGCLDRDKRTNLIDSARNSEKGGHFREAGLTYAYLGDTVNADRMAKLCEETGKDGAEEIRMRLAVRAKAKKVYDMSPKTETPAVAPKTETSKPEESSTPDPQKQSGNTQ